MHDVPNWGLYSGLVKWELLSIQIAITQRAQPGLSPAWSNRNLIETIRAGTFILILSPGARLQNPKKVKPLGQIRSQQAQLAL